MTDTPQNIIDLVNKPGRIGILCTADADGQPNTAYFGSPRFRKNNTFSLGLIGGRTLKNLKENPKAVFFCIEKSPVSFSTPGCRLYLEVREIHTEGELLEQIRDDVSKNAGADAGKMISAAVTFNVTEIRKLVDM